MRMRRKGRSMGSSQLGKEKIGGGAKGGAHGAWFCCPQRRGLFYRNSLDESQQPTATINIKLQLQVPR